MSIVMDGPSLNLKMYSSEQNETSDLLIILTGHLDSNISMET